MNISNEKNLETLRRVCSHCVCVSVVYFVWLLQASASAAARQRRPFPPALLVDVQDFQSTNEEPLAVGTHTHTHTHTLVYRRVQISVCWGSFIFPPRSFCRY